MTSMPVSPRGQRITRLDAREKLSGAPIYPSDIRISGMLHCRAVRSPYRRARVLSIDASEAEKVPGFAAIVTGEEARGERLPPLGIAKMYSRIQMFPEVVNFIGEIVAIVAAETEEAATQVADLVDVEYEELPPVLTTEEALAEGAPQLFPEGNLAAPPFLFERGDPEAAMIRAHRVYEATYRTQRQSHAPIEPATCVAAPENDGVVIWTVVDSAFSTRHQVAALLGMPDDKVHIISKHGASYGQKNVVIPSLEPACALVALKTGRPARMALTSPEMFANSSTRPACDITLRTGVDKDGRVLARTVRVIVDDGAYGIGGVMVSSMAKKAVDLYPCDNIRYEGIAVNTNTIPGCAYRGVTTPQIHFALEMQMNEIAADLGIDPVELRLRDMLKTSYKLFGGTPVDAEPLRECIQQAAERFGWSARTRRRDGSLAIGSAMAVSMHHTGQGATPKEGSDVLIKLMEDGTVEVVTAVPEKGQGSETALAQIAAAAASVSMDAIRMRMGDTAISPRDELGAESNRATYAAGAATRDAGRHFHEKLAEWAGKELPETLSREDLAKLSSASNSKLPEAVGTFYPPDVDALPVFSAHFAEVQVDIDTGDVTVRRYVVAHDIGEAINPDLCESQVEGGVYHQVGYALREDLVVDDGVVMNGNFMEYSLGGFGEVIPLEVLLVETPDTPPKGVGTSVAAAVAPCIVSAIADATGRFIYQLPASPESVCAALNDDVPQRGGGTQ